MKRWFPAAVCAALCLFLSSCSVIGTSPEDLMVAPYPTGELRDVLTALQRNVKKFTPVYPKTGDTRCAFLLRDSEGGRLAFAFYTLEADPNTHLNILRQEEDEWKSVFVYNETPGKLETIEFADLDGDGSDEIITAWSLFGSLERQLNIFAIKKDTLSTVFSEEYAGFVLADLNGDELQELVVISREPSVFKAQAGIYRFSEGKWISLGSVPLDGNISEYAKISVSPGTGDAQGVYIDAYKGDGMITDVILMKNGVPVSSFMKSTPGSTNTETFRPQNLVSSDVDGDGRVEIPFLTLLPGYADKKAEERAYLTTWKRFDGISFETSFSALINMTDGYYLKFPENWIGHVTILRDNENRARTFKVWDEELSDTLETLLQIRVFSEENWKNADKNWILLQKKQGFVYAALLWEHSPLSLTGNQLRDRFYFVE